jgi:8-oxo-dGTP pyrophosphatase MutT (NUDIX family)
VIENKYGRVCGHVLAFCESRKLAYICPMEVLLEDIQRTLGAKKVCLPGGEIEQEEHADAERELLAIRESMEGLSIPIRRSRSPVLTIGNSNLGLDGRLRAA